MSEVNIKLYDCFLTCTLVVTTEKYTTQRVERMNIAIAMFTV